MAELFEMLKRPFDGNWDAVESNMEVFEHILFRLPVRSIFTFKSVSKHWRSALLSSKYFIMMHRYCSMRNPKYFVFYDAGDFEDGIVREMHQMERDGAYCESYVIRDFEAVHHPLLIASFNGLICCTNDVSPSTWVYEMDLRICNPATREHLLLPRGRPSVVMPVFGVVYSVRYHFYKIFKFFTEMVDLEAGYSLCEVYSSKTGQWKLLGRVATYPLMNPGRPLVANHVCVNEKVYWFVADEEEFDIPTSILVADMDENFWEIELPTDTEISFLIELHGCPCFIDWGGSIVIIWLYYEEKDVWDMVGIADFPVSWLEVAHFYSVAAVRDEILFVYKDVSGLRHEVMYDVRLETWKDFRIPEDSNDKALVVFPFCETLLPCSSSGF